jgi:hypothetical protein
MGIGTSLLLIAIGAVLRFAISVTTHGFNIHSIGVILMIVGAVGLVLSLIWASALTDRWHRRPGYYEGDAPPAPRV